jgi:hypothetical protein
MIKIKILMAIAIISIISIIVNSPGLSTSSARAASDENNNAQTSDEGNNAKSTSDDGDNVLSFNQELLPGLSSSDQKIERHEETPPMANQSGNLQNPSIQTELNKSLPFSQKDVQLQQSKKPPGAEDCVLDKSGTTANCPTLEADEAWRKLQQAAREAAATEGSDNKAINLGQPWEFCDRSDTKCNNNFEAFKRLFEDMKNAFEK